MLHEFLTTNRALLIERCRAKVAVRRSPRPTSQEMEHGIPLFLEQLIDTLRSNDVTVAIDSADKPRVLALVGRDVRDEIAVTARRHGHELLLQGYTVDQVVHDYGDLCQAITELAMENEEDIPSQDFRTLNSCLDFAIADAVTEYSRERDEFNIEKGDREISERLGMLAHELRNQLTTAMLSFGVLKKGEVALNGATSAVIDRSMLRLRDLIDRALADARLFAGSPARLERIVVDEFIAEVQIVASIEARSRDCDFTVDHVEPGLTILSDTQMLFSAVSNLLQNAFKYTRPNSLVTLRAYATATRVFIEVADQCGGLPRGDVESIFKPFAQQSADRTGVGLGLSIARRAVEASGGTLSARDAPGAGCVFVIDLPRRREISAARGAV
jgi:signal transduction histidine kinase